MQKFKKNKRKFIIVSICCLLAVCLAVPFAWNNNFRDMVGTVIGKNKSSNTQHKAFDSAKSAKDALNDGQTKLGKVTSVNGFSKNLNSNGLDYSSSSNSDDEIVKYLKSDDYIYNSKLYDDVDLVSGDDSFSWWPTAIVDGSFSTKSPEVLSLTGQDSHFTVDLDSETSTYFPGQIISLGKTAPKDGHDIVPYNPEKERLSSKAQFSLQGPSSISGATQERELNYYDINEFKEELMNKWHQAYLDDETNYDTSSIGYDYSISSATSSTEVSAKFGLDAGKNVKIKASDEYKNDTQSLVIIYKFNDFSINLASDTPLSSLVSGYDVNDFKNNFKSSNPAGYIDSIRYGREVIVTLTTNKLSNTFAADVQSEAAGVKTEGKWQEQRANMSANVSVIGKAQGGQDNLTEEVNKFIADPTQPISDLGVVISRCVKQLDNGPNFISCQPLSCTIRHLCAYDEDTKSYNSRFVANGANCISNPLVLNNTTKNDNASYYNHDMAGDDNAAFIEYNFITDFKENGEAIIGWSQINKEEFQTSGYHNFTIPSTAFNFHCYHDATGGKCHDHYIYDKQDDIWPDPLDPNKQIKGWHTNACQGGRPDAFGPIYGHTWKDSDDIEVCNYLTYPTISDTGIVWHKYIKPQLLTHAEFNYDGNTCWSYDADYKFETNGGPEKSGISWSLHWD